MVISRSENYAIVYMVSLHLDSSGIRDVTFRPCISGILRISLVERRRPCLLGPGGKSILSKGITIPHSQQTQLKFPTTIFKEH